MAQGSIEDWSRESWALARDTVYATVLGGTQCLKKDAARTPLINAMIDALIAPLRLQIERGGLRLARLLDEAFS